MEGWSLLNLSTTWKVSDQIHVPTALPLGEEPQWVGGWVGPKAGLDAVAKGKILFPCRKLNPGLPARHLVTTLTELPRLQACVPLQRSDERPRTLATVSSAPAPPPATASRSDTASATAACCSPWAAYKTAATPEQRWAADSHTHRFPVQINRLQFQNQLLLRSW